jgi:hypothetical protein
MDVLERELLLRLGLQGLGGQRGEGVEADADQHLRQQPGVPLLETDRPRVAPRLPRQALLELFRENAVAFDQVSPLGELSVRWTGGDDLETVTDLRIDEFEGAPEPVPEAEREPETEPGSGPDDPEETP